MLTRAGCVRRGFFLCNLNFWGTTNVHANKTMKTLLCLGLFAVSAWCGRAQDASGAWDANYYGPPIDQPPVIYQTPVIYQATVVYQAPVVYYGPVYYVSAPPVAPYYPGDYGCDEAYFEPSTVVVIGGNHSPYFYSNTRDCGSGVIHLNGRRAGFH
jgi:hypothetical protein